MNKSFCLVFYPSDFIASKLCHDNLFWVPFWDDFAYEAQSVTV